MIKLKSENQLVKSINSIIKSDVYYDKSRFTIFVYADGATPEQIKRIKLKFVEHIDLNNMQSAYGKIAIYS